MLYCGRVAFTHLCGREVYYEVYFLEGGLVNTLSVHRAPQVIFGQMWINRKAVFAQRTRSILGRRLERELVFGVSLLKHGSVCDVSCTQSFLHLQEETLRRGPLRCVFNRELSATCTVLHLFQLPQLSNSGPSSCTQQHSPENCASVRQWMAYILTHICGFFIFSDVILITVFIS